jgi:hypothetical protein
MAAAAIFNLEQMLIVSGNMKQISQNFKFAKIQDGGGCHL